MVLSFSLRNHEKRSKSRDPFPGAVFLHSHLVFCWSWVARVYCPRTSVLLLCIILKCEGKCFRWDGCQQVFSLISSSWWLSDALPSSPLAQKHDSVWIQGFSDRADPLRGSTGICGPATGRLQRSAPQLRPGLLRNGDWLSGTWGNIPAVLQLYMYMNSFVLFVSCLVSAAAGVWHVCEVQAAPDGDASGWSLLSSPVGHRAS